MSQDNLIIALRGAAKMGDFTLSSGKKSDLYIDCRKVTTQSYCLKLAAQKLLETINQLDATILAGPASAAISIMAAACTMTNQANPKGFVYTRSKAKEHGTKQMVDGISLRGTEKVLLVDDVLTSGGSLLQCRNTLLGEYPDIEIVGAWVLVDRAEGGRDSLLHEGIRTFAVYDRLDIVKHMNLGKSNWKPHDRGSEYIFKEQTCGKVGCSKSATGTARGSLLYQACDDHLSEIQALVANE